MSALEKTAAGVSTIPLLHLLPQDILFEILSKLPAKSLVRFMFVSKFFYALIADHAFGVLHRSLSLTLPSRAGIIIAIMPQTQHSSPSAATYYTINFSEENPRQPGMLQANRLGYLDGEPFRKGSLGSSSDGLICLSRLNGNVVVCNVSTGQSISLPTIQSYPSLQYSSFARLGFDSQSKRYKVLMSSCGRSERRGSTQICLEYKNWVLTVGVDKSWRVIDYSSHPFLPFDYYGFGSSDTSVHIDGVIYSYNWVTRNDPPSFHIVAFEVESESYSLIPIPAKLQSSSPSLSINAFGEKYYYSSFVLRNNFALLEVDGGRLAIVYVHLFHMYVWTWEKSKECWKKITMLIPSEAGMTIYGVNGYVRYTMNHAGEEILLLCTNNEQFSILVCNLKSEVWRKFDVGGVEFPISFPREVRMYQTMDNVFSSKFS